MKKATAKVILLLLLATALIPFASSNPDGLEKVARYLGVHTYGGSHYRSPMPDYGLPGLGPSRVVSVLTGIIGMLLVCGLSLSIGVWLRNHRSQVKHGHGAEHELDDAQ